MNDSQLLARLAAEDAFAPDAQLPSTAWSAEVAFVEVERLIDAEPESTRQRDRVVTGGRAVWAATAGAFAVVLLVGLAIVFAARIADDGEPVATTQPPPTTTVPPTTSVPPTTAAPPGEPLDPTTRRLLDDLERAYNRGDTTELAALLAPGIEVSLAPWVTPEAVPSSVSLLDRAATAALFGDDLDFRECAGFAAEIRCDVTFGDDFTDIMELDPWTQSWAFEVAGGLINRIDVTGENPARVSAMEAFQNWVAKRQPDATPLVAGPHEWHRTPDAAAIFGAVIAEYTALESGVPAEAWTLVSTFFDALSTGDVAAAETLFAPGGQYQAIEASDESSASIYVEATEIGSEPLTEYLTFWYGLLQTELRPIACTGDGSIVTCRTESRGLTALFHLGGAATGELAFTLSGDRILTVVDRIVRTEGSCGSSGCGENGFDIRGFWRSWMPENAPEVEMLWPGGNGAPPGGFSAEFARAILEYYPQFLVESGFDVPPQYLDGSLLENL